MALCDGTGGGWVPRRSHPHRRGTRSTSRALGRVGRGSGESGITGHGGNAPGTPRLYGQQTYRGAHVDRPLCPLPAGADDAGQPHRHGADDPQPRREAGVPTERRRVLPPARRCRADRHRGHPAVRGGPGLPGHPRPAHRRSRSGWPGWPTPCTTPAARCRPAHARRPDRPPWHLPACARRAVGRRRRPRGRHRRRHEDFPRRARWRPRSCPAPSRTSSTPPAAPSRPAWTAWSCTARTATCCTSSSPTASTSAPTATAARPSAGRASSSRSRPPSPPRSEPTGSASASPPATRSTT